MLFFPVHQSLVLILFTLTIFSIESTKAQKHRVSREVNSGDKLASGKSDIDAGRSASRESRPFFELSDNFSKRDMRRGIENRSRYLNDLLRDSDSERTSEEDSEQEMDLDPETLEQARRTISHLSPATRRFLFSPTIQNTITNLNQNTNTQELVTGGRGKGSKGSKREGNPEQILGYLNSLGDVEYDLKGKVKKICFIIG